MGKLSDVADGKAERHRPGPRGNLVDRILEDCDDDDRALLESWLRDTGIGCEWIADELGGAGIEVSDSTIRRWRKREGIRSVWAA